MNKTVIGQYISLFVSLSFFAVLFQHTGNTSLRFLIIVISAALYVAWGYWHHSVNERVTKMVMLEYFLVSAFVVVLAALGLGIFRFI